MSKVSSSNFPSYSGSTVSIGNSKATTGVSGGSLVSEYQMSEPESAIYNYALNTLASILPGVNTLTQILKIQLILRSMHIKIPGYLILIVCIKALWLILKMTQLLALEI